MADKIELATANKAQCLSEAERWLNKAVEFEADPTKSEKLMEMAFKRAVDFENAAFDGRS